MPGILIKEVEYQGEVTDLFVSAHRVTPFSTDVQVIEGKGLIACPAFSDYHVHFRDPGLTEKEDLLSGARAAAAGGYARVVCEPNTRPVIDSVEAVNAFSARAQALPIAVATKVAVTRGQQGTALTDIAGLLDEFGPFLGFSDDGEPMTDKALLVEAFRLTGEYDIPISAHCEETPRSADRVRAALGDGPALAREPELIALAIDALAEAGMGRLHIQHVSLAESVALIARAQARHLDVTAEVAPHHLVLCEEDIPLRHGEPDPNWKMNPPLRRRADMLAMRQALADGVIREIATDHAPHTAAEKARSWAEAPFGVIGLETAFGACLSLVQQGELAFPRLLQAMTSRVNLVGADVTLVDLHHVWTVDPDKFYSKGRNCPFAGMTFTGKPVYTIAGGKLVMAEGDVLF